MRATDSRVPVTLLTGFLGSGKTTLLRRLLSAEGMGNTAVLVNEFGEIGLDHLLVRAVHGSAVVLQNGCVCCTLRADLQQELRDLIDGRAREGAPPFDRIAIETTGLADPVPVVRALAFDPMLRHQIRLASTVTTVDAVNGAGQLQTHGESLRQAAMADCLVITKSDIALPKSVAALRQALADLNPTARIVDAQVRGFDPRNLFTDGFADPAGKIAEVRRWLGAAPRDDECHAHAPGHDHAAHGLRHGAEIRSFALRIEETVDWTAFGVWLTCLLSRHGARVLRVKGLLNVSDALGPVVLHTVQHIVHPPSHLEAWPDADTSSRLVFVVERIEPELIRHSLRTFLAVVRRSEHAA